MKYVNIFQGDFIMGLGSLLGPIFKQVLGGVGGRASQQPAAIKRTAEETQPTPLEQVNAAVPETKNPQELKQLNAPEQITTAPSTAAIMPEVLQNAEPLAATSQSEIKPTPAVKLELSQEALNSFKSIFSQVVNGLKPLKPIFSSIEAQIIKEIKAFSPQSPFDNIFSESIQKNGGSEAVRQQLETNFKNTLNRVTAQPQITAKPA